MPKAESNFKCYVCDKTFSVNSAFLTHLRTHTGEKPFTCNVCNTSFALNSDLKRHSTIHTGEKPYVCKECGKKFSRKSYLKTHLISHTGEKPFVCDVCKKAFSSKWDLQTHRRIHAGERTFVCKICDKGFSVKSNFRKHVLSHDEGALLAGCACNTKFSKESDLKSHRCIHSGKKQIACKLCDKSFFKVLSLKKHMRKHSRFVCYVCMTGFSKKSELTAHRSIHKEEKHCACDQCGKRFTNEYSLQKHVLLAHAGEAQFVCSTCNTKFSQESELKAHCCVQKKEKQYACNECNRSFSREKSLKRHLHVHAKEGLHVCNICNAKFSRNFDLKMHYCIHEEEKKFACKYCNRRFAKDSSLKKHIHIHFICNVCNSKFSEESDYNEHILTHVGGGEILIDKQDQSSSHGCNLETHDLVHTEAVFFVCNTCDSMFSKVSDLKAHHCINRGEEVPMEQEESQSQSINPETPNLAHTKEAFVCNTCNTSFSQESDLKSHKCAHKEEKEFACNQCDKKFSKEGSLKKHVHVHARVALYMECSTCNIRFSQESDMKAHHCLYREGIRIEMQNKISQDGNLKTDLAPVEEVLFVCSFCGTIFPQESDLNAHLCTNRVKEILFDKQDNNHFQDSNLKTNSLVHFICNTCNSRFSQESDLRAHQCISETQKQFACKICNRRFAKDSSLKKHVYVHAQKGSFACSTCKIRFFKESDCKAHRCLYRKEEIPVEKQINSQDGNLETNYLTPAEQVLFVCSNCGTLFSQESEFKVHQCIGITGEFVLDKQDKNFIQDFNLQTQNLTHTEEFLYICNSCNTIFSQESELKTHQCIIREEQFLLENHDQNVIQDINLNIHDLVPAGEVLFVCNTCHTLFSQESELKAHHCFSSQKELPIDKNEEGHSQDFNLKTNYIALSEEVLFVCNTCEARFSQESELKAHLCISREEKFHSDNHVENQSQDLNLKTNDLVHAKGVFVCNNCSARFSQESEMTAHLCINREEKIPDKHVKNPSQNLNLETNDQAHAKGVLFVCNTCKARFSQEMELKAHFCISREEKFHSDNHVKNQSQDLNLKTNDLVHAKGVFVCNNCNARFSQESELKAHLCIGREGKFHSDKHVKNLSQDINLKMNFQAHAKEALFVCNTCKARFSQESELKAHLCISREEKFHSDKHVKNLSQDLNLKTNDLAHVKGMLFVCNNCNARFSQESELTAHLCIGREEKFHSEKHVKNLSQDLNLKMNNLAHAKGVFFVCNSCKANFSQESELNEHHCVRREKKLHSDKNEKNHSQDLNLKINYLTHAKRVFFACNTCKAKFSQESELYEHLCIGREEKFHSYKNDKNHCQDSDLKTNYLAHAKGVFFVCNNCKAKFSQESELNEHHCIRKEEKFHSNQQDKNNSQDLNLKTHAEEALFVCKTCEARFSQECDLQVHMSVHVKKEVISEEPNQSLPEDVNVKRNLHVQPAECEPNLRIQTVDCEPNLRIQPADCEPNLHVQPGDCEPNLRIQPVEKPFICDICSKSFYDKATLRTHLRVHTRERSFVCSVCKKNFLTDSALKTHLHFEIGRNYFA